MCIGIPMQVIGAGPGCVRVRGRDGERTIGTQLVGACTAGDWLLVFIDDARERLSAARAAEIDSALDLLDSVLRGAPADAPRDPGFALPSALAEHELHALVGAARST